MRTYEEKVRTLKAWLKRRAEKGLVVTADELIDRIKQNWPTTSEEDLERLYQEVGHL